MKNVSQKKKTKEDFNNNNVENQPFLLIAASVSYSKTKVNPCCFLVFLMIKNSSDHLVVVFSHSLLFPLVVPFSMALHMISLLDNPSLAVKEEEEEEERNWS